MAEPEVTILLEAVYFPTELVSVYLQWELIMVAYDQLDVLALDVLGPLDPTHGVNGVTQDVQFATFGDITVDVFSQVVVMLLTVVQFASVSTSIIAEMHITREPYVYFVFRFHVRFRRLRRIGILTAVNGSSNIEHPLSIQH